MKTPVVSKSCLKKTLSFIPCTFASNSAPAEESGLKSTMLADAEIAEIILLDERVGSCKIGVAIGITDARKPVVEAKADTNPPTYETARVAIRGLPIFAISPVT